MRDYLVLSELAKGHRTALELGMAHYIREEYVRESLLYHSSLGRVTRFGKLLRRKKAAALRGLTEDGRTLLPTLQVLNTSRRRDLMRKLLPKRDYMRYRWLKRSVELQTGPSS